MSNNLLAIAVLGAAGVYVYRRMNQPLPVQSDNELRLVSTIDPGADPQAFANLPGPIQRTLLETEGMLRGVSAQINEIAILSGELAMSHTRTRDKIAGLRDNSSLRAFEAVSNHRRGMFDARQKARASIGQAVQTIAHLNNALRDLERQAAVLPDGISYDPVQLQTLRDTAKRIKKANARLRKAAKASNRNLRARPVPHLPGENQLPKSLKEGPVALFQASEVPLVSKRPPLLVKRRTTQVSLSKRPPRVATKPVLHDDDDDYPLGTLKAPPGPAVPKAADVLRLAYTGLRGVMGLA